jgi:UPF0716 protein FxsA
MVLFFVLLLVVWPIAELVVVIKVAELVGIPLMLGLLLLGCVAGGLVLRYSGRTAWRRFQEAVRAGRTPTREVVDGALVVGAGVLLLVPGFITDAVGLFLLFPPTRALVRGLVTAYATSNLVVKAGTTAYGGASAAFQRRGRPRRPGDPPGAAGVPPAAGGYDVEGTAVEVDQRRLEE